MKKMTPTLRKRTRERGKEKERMLRKTNRMTGRRFLKVHKNGHIYVQLPYILLKCVYTVDCVDYMLLFK